MSREQFDRAWSKVAYLFPGLHPDGYEDADSGWPRALKWFAAVAWRHADAGELADEELYCCDAQWSGLYDVFTKAKRSEVMSRIRGRGNKDTELVLAKLLRAAGITGWRRHVALPGRPDFTFRKQRITHDTVGGRTTAWVPSLQR